MLLIHLVLSLVPTITALPPATVQVPNAGVPGQGSSDCTAPMPADWLPRCLAANIFVAPADNSTELQPEIANGYIGTILHSGTVYAGGFFNGDAVGKLGPATHRAGIPHYEIALHIDEAVRDETSTGRALDVERAVFYERSRTVGGVAIEQRWYAHATRPSLLVHEVDLVNEAGAASASVAFTTAVGSSADLALAPFNVTARDLGFDSSSVGYAMYGANKVPEDATHEGNGNHTFVAIVANAPPSAPVVVAPAESRTFTFLFAIVTSLNSTAPRSDALAALRSANDAAAADPGVLLAEHTAAWAARARRGSLSVVGDLRLAQALNASLYSLRSSAREDWPYGLSPGGLASDGYSGHTFWDQETWMWPPLLFLDPPTAASLLAYRHARIEGAAAKASTCGQPNAAYCPPTFTPGSGAMRALLFPWESAFTGVETQYVGGNIKQWGKYEQHVSGDISFAVRQYFYATRDLEWLKRVGYPIISGVANFYARRFSNATNSAGAKRGAMSYDTVMGPDEYACVECISCIVLFLPPRFIRTFGHYLGPRLPEARALQLYGRLYLRLT